MINYKTINQKLNRLTNKVKRLSFDDIRNRDSIFLYAGDIPNTPQYSRNDIVGLSLTHSNYRTIKFDIRKKIPLPDNCVNCYQAEDVFEHIEYDLLYDIINEIYRILKLNGYFRLSVPDYRCDVLQDRCIKDAQGNFIFDPMGGGRLTGSQVINGGHVWFPIYETVKNLIEQSLFSEYRFLHYYNTDNVSITNPIDYSMGYVQRTPDNDERVRNPYRAMSIVVDLFKL